MNSSQFPNAERFDRPIFIVAGPRSGSTMTFETLEQNRKVWTLGDESHRLFESIRALHPMTRMFESNALDESDLTPEIASTLISSIFQMLRNSQGNVFLQLTPDAQPTSFRFLEKTPKNALRIPFLKKLFPNALFIYLHRQCRPNIASIIDAWNSGRFVTYPNLPNWSGQRWSLLLPKGWQQFNGKPLAHIAAWQWAATNKKIIDDLQQLPDSQSYIVSYEAFLQNKPEVLQSMCTFADIPYGPRMELLATEGLPNSKYTLSAPDPDKWKRHQAQIEAAIESIPEVEEVQLLIESFENDAKYT